MLGPPSPFPLPPESPTLRRLGPPCRCGSPAPPRPKRRQPPPPGRARRRAAGSPPAEKESADHARDLIQLPQVLKGTGDLDPPQKLCERRKLVEREVMEDQTNQQVKKGEVQSGNGRWLTFLEDNSNLSVLKAPKNLLPCSVNRKAPSQ